MGWQIVETPTARYIVILTKHNTEKNAKPVKIPKMEYDGFILEGPLPLMNET